MSANKIDARQSRLTAAQAMLGSAAGDTLDTIFPKINDELAKLFEDRNIMLADGGVITIPSAGTSITFTQALKLHVNSQVAGGTPTIIDLAATTRTLSANLKMVYAVINRTAGTAVVTDDASSLPAQTSANQEVVLIAKRIDSADGTKTVYFRDGTIIIAGQSARLGSPSALDSSFTIGDATDPTKQIGFDAAGTTGTKTTLTGSQTANRNLTLPDITDTLVSRTNTETLSNKQMQYSSSNDSTTTGSNASLQAFTTGIVRLTNASLVSVSGIPAGSSGQILIIENKTGNQISINNEETTPTAANRIQTGSGSNVSMPNNATFAFTYDSTSSRWQLTGGSGSGSGSGSGKNYLSAITTSQSTTPNTGNGNFESGSTTGWSLGTVGTLTNNIPTGTPTFGSGASGNLSISTVSSGQLAGTYSLSYASSAATTQGDMLASDAFYIDTEDQAKVLGFKFYYKAQTNPTNGNFSGTSSNSFAVAAWDVTNSAWLPLTGNFGMTQSSGVGVASGTFQTAINTTQIRFIMYNANASAGAITMYFDDFFVGPQIIPQGAVITDWQEYTPTITGFGTVTSNSAKSRRVGDTLEVQGIFVAGTPTATQGLISLGFNGGNSNISIDTSKISNGQTVVGVAGVNTSSTTYFGNYITVGTNTTAVQINTQTSTNSALQSTNGNITSGIGNTISYSFFVPIVGWSSNVQMSNDTDTRVVAATYQANSSQSLTSTAVLTVFGSKISDTHAAYNSSTGIYTIPVSGLYEMTYQVFTITATSPPNNVILRNNGNTMVRSNASYQNVANTYQWSQTYIFPAIAGDNIDMQIAASAAGSTYNSGIDNFFSIKRLSGPSVVAASEVVAVFAQGVCTGTLNASYNRATYPSIVKDTHGAYSSGLFTAPVSGYYKISAGFYISSTVVALGDITVIGVRKNGGATPEASNMFRAVQAGGNGPVSNFISVDSIYLNAGDTLDVVSKSGMAGVLSYTPPLDGSQFYLSICKVK